MLLLLLALLLMLVQFVLLPLFRCRTYTPISRGTALYLTRFRQHQRLHPPEAQLAASSLDPLKVKDHKAIKTREDRKIKVSASPEHLRTTYVPSLARPLALRQPEKDK